MYKLVNEDKITKIVGQPSWTTPEVLGCYENEKGTKQARLMYGKVMGQLDIWGIELVDIKNKELIDCKAFTDPESALWHIKLMLN